jgi:hypothetical protein
MKIYTVIITYYIFWKLGIASGKCSTVKKGLFTSWSCMCNTAILCMWPHWKQHTIILSWSQQKTVTSVIMRALIKQATQGVALLMILPSVSNESTDVYWDKNDKSYIMITFSYF